MRRPNADQALQTVPPVARWSPAVVLSLGFGAGLGVSPASAQTGLDRTSLRDWLDPFFQTIEIGTWTFAPARLIVAALLFAALIVAFRLLRRWLAATVLDPKRMEPSAAHSIDKAVGYAGFTLAALTALSVAGLDITNVAIVAGALSVGIGFGLQSIINNFVSGLILLAERPVKVGDWVEIKGIKGRVSRISVRATVIETADKASVFVPNADLILNAVSNLTPHHSGGTAVVRVGVAHSAEPHRVTTALEAAAASSPYLAASPAASVAFEDIGASALQFTVRGAVADVGQVGVAESDLRARVVSGLNAAGIAIARPQTDVHLRDLDAVRTVLMRALEERERRNRMTDAETVDKPGT